MKASFFPWGQIIHIVAFKTGNYAGDNFFKNLIKLILIPTCFLTGTLCPLNKINPYLFLDGYPLSHEQD